MSRKETRNLLASMESKGYTKIGVIFKSHRVLDVLLIHKDWKEFDLLAQYRQVMDDIPQKLKVEYMIGLDIPTREMYDNERTEDSPKHTILVDLGPYSEKNLWERKGLFYYATLKWYKNNILICTTTKKLGFISYHLIKKIHGIKGLNEMARKSSLPFRIG